MKLRTLAVISLLIFVGLFASQPPVKSDDASVPDIELDFAVDDTRGLIYRSDYEANTVSAVSMFDGTIIDQVIVGPDPHNLDISPDFTQLAVTLPAAGEIVFVDLETFEVEGRVSPDTGAANNMPWDVVYGKPGRLYSVGRMYYEDDVDYLHVIDTETMQEVGRSTETLGTKPSLSKSPDNNYVYVGQTTYGVEAIQRFDVSTDTPVLDAQTSTETRWVDYFCVTADKVFTNNGAVFTADLGGEINHLNYGDYLVACSPIHDRVVYTGERYGVFDASSYEMIYGRVLSCGRARFTSDESAVYYMYFDEFVRMPLAYNHATYLPCVYGGYCQPHYADDFSDPNSNWPVTDSEYVRTEYLYGEYRILTRIGGYLYAFRAPTCARENYAAQVQVHWQDAPGMTYGMVFGIKENWDYYYIYEVSTAVQGYRLLYVTPTGVVEVVGPTPTSTIKQGQQINTFGIRNYDRTIELIMNGQTIRTVTKPVSDTGGLTWLGVMASSYTDSPVADARFDNFTVNLLETGGASATADLETAVGPLSAQPSHTAPHVADWEW